MQVSFHMYRAFLMYSSLTRIRVAVSYFTDVSYMRLSVTGPFSHIQVSFHICRSLFTYTGLFSQTKVSFCICRAFLMYSSHTRIRVAVSYFTDVSFMRLSVTGLFSHIQVSFHICRSLFAYTGLFSHIQVSFHICRSLFACAGLFGCTLRTPESEPQSPIVHNSLFSHMQVSFHTCWSLFTEMQVSFWMYSSHTRIRAAVSYRTQLYAGLLCEKRPICVERDLHM